ncbi:acetyl-CoA carboxylase [Pectobacteriaceae bacterium CE70]|uniref:Biotin carboxyl carrier protein of acetyl-CoA carboxylase n=1 Tax=Serratia sp. (strain ATCC 39006) TaxID=104623 RepID=A0A2I5T9S2_SERS3|nr:MULTISPECIES: acetyl-CoA carboxylase [Enterobacterales]WJV64105.1 acetyl-CoA carboxylase [Pectobacteriaceae bacterium C52]WJV68518.1 acetyl-CoA carboxylase [Pectobacteriaceae bacterium CE70]WJY12448.1 acetyl-CoA carboxylase [Pectobacteriaceae bacterium C80]WJY13556.1 acetyl-CoA carboxylase [Pectobacteriaceae bacterium CE90]AUH01272.1 acetyl-CoA carboxylase biotin carboxyl carrier protein subunit [Serratia sp. ATCC 39006]
MKEYEICSPLPGIFYRQPAPDVAVYIEENDVVTPNTVIGLIEVMKQFSEIYAEQDGRLITFKVSNGEAVEPGQVIAIIKTDR